VGLQKEEEVEVNNPFGKNQGAKLVMKLLNPAANLFMENITASPNPVTKPHCCQLHYK
jgi:hypothetical protein